jgi:hypothetical protein
LCEFVEVRLFDGRILVQVVCIHLWWDTKEIRAKTVAVKILLGNEISIITAMSSEDLSRVSETERRRKVVEIRQEFAKLMGEYSRSEQTRVRFGSFRF